MRVTRSLEPIAVKQSITSLYNAGRDSYSADWVRVGDLVLSGATGGILSSVTEYVQFADAASDAVYFCVPKKDLWVQGGVIQATLLYTGSASSTNNFQVTLYMSERKVGDAGGAAHSLSTTETMPGPATAGNILSKSLSPLAVAGGGEFLTFKLQRDGAAGPDNNTGSLRLFLIKLKYLSRK